jgi:hypothetical protein
MSKMDGLRAMREARYAAAQAGKTTTAKAAKVAKRPVAPPADAKAPPAGTDEQLCGHRAISGRTCTREHGHAAKSHRYS